MGVECSLRPHLTLIMIVNMKRFILSILALVALAPLSAQTIFLIGDSTCANKPLEGDNQERGWGQMFPALVDQTLKIDNHAINGRSTKSFRAEGRWETIMDLVKPGDYIFIQFGHNDEKEQDSLRYSSPEDYGENLRQYVRESREKGAKPLLMTPIVRRNWVDGELVDTHKEYPDVVKRVAREEGVPMIDMEAITREWVKSLGDEPSKGYYLWVEKGTNPRIPKGKKDDTHLNIKGAHVVSRMVAREVMPIFPELASHFQFPDLVVAKDGSGDFFSIQEAVTALPDFSREEIWLLVRAGSYYEKVSIPASKRMVRMTGEGADKSIITFDSYSKQLDMFGRERGTSGSSTIYFGGANWQVEDITFANTAGRVGQAVAVQCLATNVSFKRCRFLGNQDTLYLHGLGNCDGEVVTNNSIYHFEECYVEGTTDFIFGSAAAYFDNCEIHSLSDSYITAASTCKGQRQGFVFRDCRLTAAEGVTKCYLGRPWREYAKTWFVDCWMGEHIRPEGWHNWSKKRAERTVEYGEWGSKGPGAEAAKRVGWATKLNEKSARKL